MRVSHVITDLDVGGAERLLVRLATWRGEPVDHAVVVLSREGPLTRELRAAGVPVAHLDMTGPAHLPLVAGRLLRALRDRRPQVVHTWMPHANLLGGLAGRRLRLPVLWSVHHDRLGADYGSARAVERLNRRLSAWLPSAVVHTSVRAAAAVGGTYRVRDQVVIGNAAPEPGARDDARSWLRDALGLPPDALLMGSVGRDHPQKDRATYVAAAALLRELVPQVQHVLVGRGLDLTSSLSKTAQVAAVRVHLLGERADAVDIMAGLDVLVSSSAYGETTPLVLSEALAHGVPVVATDVGDCAALVGPGGFVVPPRDPGALAAAAARVLRMQPTERRALGAAGRDWVLRRYSLSSTANAYAATYSRLADCG